MSDTLQDLEPETSTSKKTKVTVTATAVSHDPWVSFAMTSAYPDKGGEQDGDKLKFNNKAGSFELTFDLVDQTALNLAFYPTVAEAMWIAVGPDCPTVAGDGGGAIVPVSVTNKKLVVTNRNGVAQTLTFALRFTGTASPGGYPAYVYDPKIINGGEGMIEDEDERGEGCD